MQLRQVLEHPVVYRAWQGPFVSQKIRPVVASGCVARAIRVLDVGCGPGTNAKVFAGKAYLGVDLSSDYIDYARRTFPGSDFLVRDVTRGVGDLGTFDLVLLNSLMHHLDDEAVDTLLLSLKQCVAVGGEIHILDLVLPDRPGVARLLAVADRGDHPRRVSHWESLVSTHFHILDSQPYSVSLGFLRMWRMLHIRASVND